MAKRKELNRGTTVKSNLPDCLVSVIDVKWYGSAAVELSPLPPVAIGGSIVVPLGLIWKLLPSTVDMDDYAASAEARKRMDLLARQMVMDAERQLGYEPRDVSAEKCGYDIESKVEADGRLRFIEVKGRVAGTVTVAATRNEILTVLNTPDDFILAVVQEEDGEHKLVYVREPFHNEPEFAVESINHKLNELLSRGQSRT